jgi:hypothetical protein
MLLLITAGCVVLGVLLGLVSVSVIETLSK